MRSGLAAALLLAAGIACGASAAPYAWRLPAGVKPPPVPADNPMSAGKVELGRRLFYDADLSIDGTLSCAGCHGQHRGFTEGNATHPGVRGAPGRRNVPGLANVGYFRTLTWADPDATSLERQFATPVFGEHPVEMGMQGQAGEIVRRLSADACYRRMFAEAFPGAAEAVSVPNTAKAIAAFERTLISRDAPYDRYRRGDRGALSPLQRAGERTFAQKGCGACHSGPDLTDGRYHAIAAPVGDDLGLMEKTGAPGDRGAFRTPSLRNVAATEPYLHNGAARTTAFAILSHERAAANLTQDDAQSIAAFLESLTDRRFLEDPRFALPRTACGVARQR